MLLKLEWMCAREGEGENRCVHTSSILIFTADEGEKAEMPTTPASLSEEEINDCLTIKWEEEKSFTRWILRMLMRKGNTPLIE